MTNSAPHSYKVRRARLDRLDGRCKWHSHVMVWRGARGYPGLMTGATSQVKITIALPDGSIHGAETVWAEVVSSDTFRVRNIPTWAYDVSLDDVVQAQSGGDGRLAFDRVAERGGHSTYRIRLEDGDDASRFDQRWAALQELGCRYESHSEEPLYAVDVPPDADIHRVYEILEAGEADGTWDFEEGHCGHAVSERLRERGRADSPDISPSHDSSLYGRDVS